MWKQLNSPISLPQKVSRCLGLMEYEAKAYLSLITKGTSEARSLSIKSGVPKNKIYRTLKKLVELGLAFEASSRPRNYAATPPAKTFEKSLLLFKEARAKELSYYLSPGTIYSALHCMERDGLIKSDVISRKRVYTLTESRRETTTAITNAKEDIKRL